MRILNNNVLNATNTIFSSSADNDNIENIFDNDIDFVGKFENINYGEITSTFTETTKVNTISVFNTNAKKITFEFHKEDNTIDKYTITEIEFTNIFNIVETDCKKIIVKVYGHENTTDKIYIGFLMVGLGLDFPLYKYINLIQINLNLCFYNAFKHINSFGSFEFYIFIFFSDMFLFF